jgi:hypothetical protein
MGQTGDCAGVVRLKLNGMFESLAGMPYGLDRAPDQQRPATLEAFPRIQRARVPYHCALPFRQIDLVRNFRSDLQSELVSQLEQIGIGMLK